MRSSFLRFTLLASLPLCVGAVAHADTVTDVLTPSVGGLYTNWSQAINGAQIAAAPKNGNTNTGITFAYWNGSLDAVNQGTSSTVAVPTVALGSSSTVNALFDTFYGDNLADGTVTMTNSLGQTKSYTLTGGDTIRDYNQNNYQNSLTGGSIPGGVTAQNWWNNGANGQRLDVATFYLPASWDGTDLTSFTISDISTGSAVDVLSALQVDTPSPAGGTSVTPEPSSLVLLGTGALGFAGAVRRRFRKA